MNIIRGYPCHPSNYKKGRPGAVRYLVIHYVGGLGGAKANARYYGGTPGIETSAHYFVGHASEGCPIYGSVPEGDTAWHCGAKKYRHPECRNANSIGVELCCHQDGAGRWYFDPETITAAVPLCRDIMARYGIPIDRVVRHYDVTGKNCPAPFVEDPAAWAAFKARLTEPEEKERTEDMRLYKYASEVPDWARPSVEKAIANGYIRMDAAGAMGVWECNLQALVWLDMAGELDKPAGKV